MSATDTIEWSMAHAERTWPGAWWHARYMGGTWKADTKGGLRQLLGEVRRGEVCRFCGGDVCAGHRCP